MSLRSPLATGAALLLALGSASLSVGCDSSVELDSSSTSGPGGAGGSGAGGGGGTSTGTAGLLSDGAFFFLLDLATPLETQMQLFGDVRIDAGTGAVLAQLTNANRNPDPDLCPSPCDATEVCRTLPTPECVPPSTQADGPDEYPDFVVAVDPPQGYTFTAEGTIEDNADGSAVLTTTAAKMVIVQPPVEITDLTITCTFTAGADGVLRCTGDVSAASVLIGSADAGPAAGTASGRVIPPEEAPADLPAPPE